MAAQFPQKHVAWQKNVRILLEQNGNSMSQKKEINKAAKGNHLEFLYELYVQGVDISPEDIELLKKNDYIKEAPIVAPVKEEKVDWTVDDKRIIHNDPSFTDSKDANSADKRIDVIQEGEDVPTDLVLNEDQYRFLVESKGSFLYSGLQLDITSKDWMPKSVIEHSKEFIEFIDSISFGSFLDRINYKPLNLYCQQAYQWIAENDSLSNYDDYEDRENYKDREIERCAENTLYFLNKYLKLKESQLVLGMRDYVATKAHEVIIYLFDCGYSVGLGKPRQIAATSTIGGCAIAKTIFKRNHFIKFITENESKGQEIFEDKMKYPFSALPDWMREDLRNDSGTKFAIGTKQRKGDREGANSNIDVVPPTPTAVSGGSPAIALIDEAGNIGILSDILQDARPTSFWMNPKTGKMERCRQVWYWGTGGDMERGGQAFEAELTKELEEWKNRNFESGIIPLFLDWTTRPGITQEVYDKERKNADAAKGVDAEKIRIKFRQQYPSTVEDMFLTNAKTLVSQEYITDQIGRIRKSKPMMKPKYGYFEPVYGSKQQDEGSDIPFDIIGSIFIPVDVGDPRCTVTIFHEPRKWINRYYQGTDPIASDAGLSNMASSIWDKYYNTVSATVDFRSPNYREVFLQCVLLGVYYDWRKSVGVKELLESNIGKAYQQYKENKNKFTTLVLNSELPQAFQVHSGNQVGIDNKGFRNKLIIDKVYELTKAFGGKIFMEVFFIQLKTFVAKVTDSGNETWGPADKKLYKDDVIFSIVYAYICSLCFPNEIPKEVDQTVAVKYKVVSKLEYDKKYNLHRVYKKVPV